MFCGGFTILDAACQLIVLPPGVVSSPPRSARAAAFPLTAAASALYFTSAFESSPGVPGVPGPAPSPSAPPPDGKGVTAPVAEGPGASPSSRGPVPFADDCGLPAPGGRMPG